MRAPRARAWSRASSTSAAAPSPSTRPLRLASNGRQAAGAPASSAPASTRIDCQALTVPYGNAASAPPASATAQPPQRTRRMASASATADEAQATE